MFSTCPVGLIGDDVHAVCHEMKEKLGINVFGFSCEGYKGVSQSAGHHIANNGLLKHIIGRDDTESPEKFRINMLGEYNIGGDAFVIEDLLKKCGIKLIASFSGNSTIGQFENAHTADLNCVMCHRSINYVAEMIQTKYGIPWIKVNFLGAKGRRRPCGESPQYFDDAELTERVERVIEEEMAEVLEGAGGDPSALRKQSGDALRRRQPRPPLPGSLLRSRHENGGCGLRVRAPGRL